MATIFCFHLQHSFYVLVRWIPHYTSKYVILTENDSSVVLIGCVLIKNHIFWYKFILVCIAYLFYVSERIMKFYLQLISCDILFYLFIFLISVGILLIKMIHNLNFYFIFLWIGTLVVQSVRSLDLTTYTSLSPIRRGFVPGFVNYKKGCTRLAAARDKVYQLLSHGRWFSPGTPASSTTKTGRHDIAGIVLKVALNTKNQIKSMMTQIYKHHC
jgi:hypothetical protein